jgi:histone deacetylase 11
MGISKEGIIERDAFVFGQAQEKEIPICMVLSGGYTHESHEIVSKSILNLATKNLIYGLSQP